MKWIYRIIILMAALAVILGIYLQPNSFALCPYSNGEPSSRKGCGPAEAIVVISGGDTPSRTKKAVELYKKEWAPIIIFSGAAIDKEGPSNAAAMRQDALNQGVPAKDILLEEWSENTKQNANKTRNVLESNNIHDIILVTSGYHQRRANLEFRAATKGDKVAVRNAPTSDKDWHWWWWATPRGWWLAIGEFGRIIVFYVRGGSV